MGGPDLGYSLPGGLDRYALEASQPSVASGKQSNRGILKLFEISVGGTGFSLQMAAREGYEVFSAFVVQFDRAHFFPNRDLMYLEMDILNALGNTAENVLAGKNRTINPEQVLEMWKAKDPDRFLFLDCRGWGMPEPFVQKYPDIWKSIPQDQLPQRLDEVPSDRQLILVCNTGVRSYEAQIAMDQAGLGNCLNLQGGVAALKKLGLEI